jgi:hypothetical protein
MPSSSVSEICPRSILRYRPIEADVVPDIWTHPTATRHSTTQQSQPVIATPASSSSLALATIAGLGMGLMLMLILAGQSFVSWAHLTLDDWQYGRPRTFQMDAFVGQEQAGQPSHFLAINNHGQVEIIDLPGNDPAHARLFLGPHLTGVNADLIPVTLRFLDPQHTHRPDMVVQCGTISVLFRNQQGTFQVDTQTHLS